MRTMEHLLGITGRLLIWLAGALVLEELTLAGLARLIVRRVSEVRMARAEAARESGPARGSDVGQLVLKENVHASR